MQEEEFTRITTGLLRGERLFLSKAITLAETQNPQLFSFRNRLLELAESRPKSAGFRLSVTGVPGAGKSTLINQLGLHWIKSGHRVAVLAVDPSSEVSQGSVLGDKTRMAELSREENAFIRPSPTRLHLGGVASTTYETLLLCEMAGFDRIIVETVGVGQSELEASQLTDACLLLLIAGTGDELQAVKRGILEAGDLFLINKADGENNSRAQTFARELKQMAAVWAKKENRPEPEIFCGSGINPSSAEELAGKLDAFHQFIDSSGLKTEIRRKQVIRRADILLRMKINERLVCSAEWEEVNRKLREQLEKEPERLFSEINEITLGFSFRFGLPG